MQKIYEGKTKTVYQKPDGKIILYFKDDVTGEDGRIDPGSNTVLGQVEGKGKASLGLSAYFFELLAEKGIPTHYITSNLLEKKMEVKKAVRFGDGLEFICRLRAYGSFLKRYGAYIDQLQELNHLVEITLKDDQRGDPLLNDDALLELKLMEKEQLERAKELTRASTKIVAANLKETGLELVDIKFEFGLVNGEVVVIDEISGDGMRVMDREGHFLAQKELYAAVKGA